MARAVREQLHLGLGVQPPRASVWLLGPPPRLGVHGDAWALVCLAAVAAMEHGRAHLWALHHQGGGQKAWAKGGQQDLQAWRKKGNTQKESQGKWEHQAFLEHV